MPIATGQPRERLIAELAGVFPDADAASCDPDAAASQPFRGGRAEAERRLGAIDPRGYATSRNHVAGAVSQLSPWIRHGVLSLAEVRDAALDRAGPAGAEKFIFELGWRDYWRRVHATLGDAIGADVEAPVHRSRMPPQDVLPADVLAGETGLACMDHAIRRLLAVGWIHNHERMWLASWLVHVRGVRWRAGADWFLTHLLDGDPASNHLSWQWVAGRFSSKPYIFNRDNLERFTDGEHCRRCGLAEHCPVAGDYDALSARLFEDSSAPRPGPALKLRPAEPWEAGPALAKPLVWVTLDSLSPRSPAVSAWPDAPRVFVVDRSWLADERPSLKRLVFIWECLADLRGLEIVVGEPAAILADRAAARGCDGIAVADTPCPRVRRAATRVAASLPVRVEDWPRFCDPQGLRDLARFSRYWQAVKDSALRPTRG